MTNKHRSLILISVMGTLSVLFLHTNGCFYTFGAHTFYWQSAVAVDGIFTFAIPFFFLVPGATLIESYETLGPAGFFKSRLRASVLPYAFWSLVGFFLFLALGEGPAHWDGWTLISGLLNGSLVSIYWFFPAVFSVYLSVPLFAAVPEEKRPRVFAYLVGVGFCLNVLFPFITNVFNVPVHSAVILDGVGAYPWWLYSRVSAPAFINYLLYLPLGWLLLYTDFTKKQTRLFAAAAAAGLLLHTVDTYVGSVQAGALVYDFRGYLNVPDLLYASGLFVLLLQSRFMQNPGFSRTVTFLKRYTFGIYLTHPFVSAVLTDLFNINTDALAWRALGPVLLVVLCIGLIWLVRKIPGGKSVLP